MEVKTETFYKVLGIERIDSDDIIRKAYRKLALKYHPDKNEQTDELNEKFYKIQEAYDVLSDPEKRAEYDRSLDSKSSVFFKSSTQDDLPKAPPKRQAMPGKPKTVSKDSDLDKQVEDLLKKVELEEQQKEQLRLMKSKEQKLKQYNTLDIKKEVFELCSQLHDLNKKIHALLSKFCSEHYSEIVALFNQFCAMRRKINKHPYFSFISVEDIYLNNIEQNENLYKDMLGRVPENIRARYESSQLCDGVKLGIMYRLQSFVTDLQMDILIGDKRLLVIDGNRFNQWITSLLKDKRSHFIYLQEISTEFTKLFEPLAVQGYVDNMILKGKNAYHSTSSATLKG